MAETSTVLTGVQRLNEEQFLVLPNTATEYVHRNDQVVLKPVLKKIRYSRDHRGS